MAILASELRIGNWILVNNEPCPIGYGVIADCAQKAKGIKNAYLDKISFDPIPLTPEILEKCGFENNGFYCTHSDPYMEISPSATGFILSVNCSEYEIGETFNHLHQLQNLYFALTGEELNYSPE